MSSTYLRSDTSEWLKFFESAGIPSKIALNYAMLFADHRIQKSHLSDLSKSLLNEIGITAVGDILAIVKHSKLVAAEEAEKMTFEEIKQQSTKKQAPTSPWNVTKTVAITRSDDVIPTKRQKRAPDHDVVYTKKLPAGTTERSKMLLLKAAEAKRTQSNTHSVFDRLGLSVSRDEALMRKNVKFASGTKEGIRIKEGSPEVSSTTKDDFPILESDKIIARKQSALGRLGPKAAVQKASGHVATGSGINRNALTGTKIVVVGGQRKILTPVRRSASATGTGLKTTGGGNVKLRLGQRTTQTVSTGEKANVFNRLGTRQSF